MISTKCLWRVVARSLYGLVTFLCTRYPRLTLDLTLERLLATGATLHMADPYLFNKHDLNSDRNGGWQKLRGSNRMPFGLATFGTFAMHYLAVGATTPSASIKEAYAAAAAAAFHRKPLLHEEFLGSSNAKHMLMVAVEKLHVESALSSQIMTPDSGRILSQQSLDLVSELVMDPSSHPQQEPAPLKFKTWQFPNAIESEDKFWGQHKRVSSMVTAALSKFSKSMEQPSELHIICGVNELVGGRPRNMVKGYECYNQWDPVLCERSHVNFLAVPKGQSSPAVLFFAEDDNYLMDGKNCEKDEDTSCWCVPMSLQDPEAEQVRCIYCESEGSKILHPPMKGFYGRDKEFEMLLRGEAPFSRSGRASYVNDILVRGQAVAIDHVYDLADGSIYTNYCLDESNDGEKEDWGNQIVIC